MKLFGRPTGSPKIGGEIGYHNLADWWLSNFGEEERGYIETRYKPLGVGPTEERPLTQGHITHSTGTPTQLLSTLSTWFEDPEDRHIARRLLAKAEGVATGNTLDLHFVYMQMIKVYYRNRDTQRTSFNIAVNACEKQIAVAHNAAAEFRREYPNQPLPAHTGFEQLAIIREKQKAFDKAIRLATAAKEMGWAGDWDKRIERCERKNEGVRWAPKGSSP